MNCLTEAIGMGLPGNGTIPAVYSERLRLAKYAGMRIMELLERGITARQVMTPAAVRNAMTLDMAFGGSSNTVLHLTAIAHEAGADITLDDWSEVSAATPNLVRVSPASDFHMQDLHADGGIPAIMAELAKRGLIDLDVAHRHRTADAGHGRGGREERPRASSATSRIRTTRRAACAS